MAEMQSAVSPRPEHERNKRFARFDMGAVAAIRNHLDLRRRKVPADDRMILRLDIGRLRTGKKPRRAGESIGRRQRIFLQLRQRGGQRGQVDLPRPLAVGSALEIGREKFPHAPAGHAGFQAHLGLAARMQVGQVELVHRREIRAMRRPEIVPRRDVGHQQPLHPGRLAAGQQHRRFPSHAVPEQGHPRQLLRVKPSDHVRHHVGISHRIRARRIPVIPHVERQDVIRRRQLPPRGLPVTR